MICQSLQASNDMFFHFAILILQCRPSLQWTPIHCASPDCMIALPPTKRILSSHGSLQMSIVSSLSKVECWTAVQLNLLEHLACGFFFWCQRQTGIRRFSGVKSGWSFSRVKSGWSFSSRLCCSISWCISNELSSSGKKAGNSLWRSNTIREGGISCLVGRPPIAKNKNSNFYLDT